MADLTAKFSMIDEMSDKLAGIAESGQAMLGQWGQAGETANAAFEGLTGAAATTVTTADGIATSISNLQEASNGAQTSADSLSDTLNNYGTAAEEAASQTDYWTDSVGNYNKSMLEAVYSTEELVEMGYKSAAALEEEQEMFALCEQSADYLNKALEGSEEIQNNLNAAISQASSTLSELADNENVSAEAKAELERNSAIAAEAMQELSAAQQEAAAAMENYDAVLASGTTDLSELEAAAERAYHAADNLAEANGKASDATEELSKSTQEASEQADKAGDSGQNAVESIAGALAAAGITAMVKEIGDAAYELADAFSEAESTVVLATGATGEALDRLTASMMNAYAASKTGTLDETASVVGEINTRLAYTGDMLEETTGQFLDFAAITGGDATAAVRSVTQLMNQWNVPATEMETMLSKLAYAGQASGISVDSLSQQLTNNKAILDQLGFTLDQAIAMFMNFELAGTNSTAVMTGFRTALSKGEISSLTELNNVFDQIASGAMDAAQASELFGSRAGPAIVNAVQGGVLSLDDFVSALEAASGTLATTADTAQTLDQKWSQATGNINAAFTTALEPTLGAISTDLAEMVNGVGDFLNEHPALTKAITAIGVGLGVVVTGIAGVTFVTTVAVPAVTAFGVALNTALGPIGWVALAITGVVAAGAALAAMFSEDIDVTENMTMKTRQQEEELENLNAEYEEACRVYGKTSEEAGELALQISQLEEEHANSAETIGEFAARVEESGTAIDNRLQSYQDAIDQANELGDSSITLVSELLALSGQSNMTGDTLDMMGGIVDKLNSSYDNLGLTLDKTTGKLNISTADLYEYVEKAAEQEKQQAAMNSLTEALARFGDVKEQSEQAAQEVADAWDNYEALEEKWKGDHPILKNIAAGAEMNWSSELGTAFDEWQALSDVSTEARGNYTDLIKEIETYCEQLGYSSEETEEFINQLESAADSSAKLAEQMDETEDSAVIGAEAAATAYEGIREEVEKLCEAYDEAYNAALESFEGQFGLFDKASMKSEDYKNATIENAQKAVESQLAYWESYSADVETLKSKSAADLGITQDNYETLMSYAQDGSEQAAGLAHNMAEAIKSGDENAVKTLADTLGKVTSKQDEIAKATADWQTDFTSQMDQYAQDMANTVKKMDLSAEAAASATSTINGYVNSIKAGKAGAVAAAQDIANSVSTALKSANTTVNVSTGGGSATTTATPAHANGTTNAENMFIAGEAGPELIVSKAAAYATGTTNSDEFYIAGENGPELIIGQQGSTVFPTEETDRLIESLGNREREPLSVRMDGLDNDKASAEEVKRVLLEIAGSGAIEVGGKNGMDKESVLEILTEHVKPVLLSILQQEIYEEGDLSYEF